MLLASSSLTGAPNWSIILRTLFCQPASIQRRSVHLHIVDAVTHGTPRHDEVAARCILQF